METTDRADDGEVIARAVTVSAAGASRPAFLAIPDGRAWKSAVVVVGDAKGLDEGVRAVARRLAAEGYGALAIGHGAPAGDEPAADGVARWVDAALLRLRREATAPPPRFGIVGFGAGGFVALVAGYRCQLGAAVCLYGAGPMRLRRELRRVIDRPKRHAAALLFLLGVEDRVVRAEDLAAIHERLEMFGMRHTVIVYPKTRGAFCCPDDPDYRAAEAEDAWRRVLRALDTAPRLRNRSPPKRAVHT